MLTINTLSWQNVDAPGKVLLVQVNGRLYALTDRLNQPNTSRVDVVVYQAREFMGLPCAPPGVIDQATGQRDKIAIGEGDGRRASVRAAIEKYLTDNGAKPVCQSHLDPLTDAAFAAMQA
jgi:hypothetical protein